jgi:hypothetical protein
MFDLKGLTTNRFKDMARNSPQRLMEADGSEGYQSPGSDEGRAGQENLYLAHGSS